MAELFLHNRKADSVFHLLGEDENDISYSVAWALSQCTPFLREFIQKVVGIRLESNGVIIRLQHPETDGGITDIEIESPMEFYAIIEAKRGWDLPNRIQLTKYANRASFRKTKAPIKCLVALSECSREYALYNLESCKIEGVPVKPVSWKEIAKLAIKAYSGGSHSEKRLIKELLRYLRGVMTMQKIDSNWVYVVSLASGKPENWNISLINIVNKRLLYFHPLGKSGWPHDPPNYIAFRYDGKMQSIHHIDTYEVFTNPHKFLKEIPSENWRPHFLYHLGPAFSPGREVKTGNIYPNGRVWCMLDTLFTCKTISAARDLSRKREKDEQDI